MSRFHGGQFKGANRQYKQRYRESMARRDEFWIALDNQEWDRAEELIHDFADPVAVQAHINMRKKWVLESLTTTLEKGKFVS